jgi:hypothetical protein
MNKIFGWTLILIGLIIIFLGIYSSYNVFTAKSEAPEIFPLENELDNGLNFKSKEEITFDQNLEEQAGALIEEKLNKMIPVDSLPMLFNLLAWSVFIGILIFAGTQIVGIGIKLIKV